MDVGSRRGRVVSTTSNWTRDKLYGRRGGNWISGEGGSRTGPPCSVCGEPMVVGQKVRHGVCSPPSECCGYPIDLIHDMPRHLKQHAEMT